MQIAKSFDKESLLKIVKGALIAATGAGAIAFLGYIQAIQISDPILTGFIAWLVPVAVNAIREWMKGEIAE